MRFHKKRNYLVRFNLEISMSKEGKNNDMIPITKLFRKFFHLLLLLLFPVV